MPGECQACVSAIDFGVMGEGGNTVVSSLKLIGQPAVGSILVTEPIWKSSGLSLM
jgi:hypothetical protein